MSRSGRVKPLKHKLELHWTEFTIRGEAESFRKKKDDGMTITIPSAVKQMLQIVEQLQGPIQRRDEATFYPESKTPSSEAKKSNQGKADGTTLKVKFYLCKGSVV